MGRFAWYYNRLRAMSVKELVWRVNQKILQRKEYYRFGVNETDVTSGVFSDKLQK
ncbi:MAG: hypothetical protein SOZ80_08605 [Prevotella sp.]|uniref:hypothetical protein n=1 Tax=Prevotella sp. TaxID=59823 RepID=UPI002A2AA7E2|nr:hypothetical protein [Prevotella sp.]MDD7317924.1 hypothetical protein [Prevotellaceae bacterium]MDY4020815.1 hypothetical protein [Prevotella sp.]